MTKNDGKMMGKRRKNDAGNEGEMTREMAREMKEKMTGK
jgi:hypothetical protein